MAGGYGSNKEGSLKTREAILNKTFVASRIRTVLPVIALVAVALVFNILSDGKLLAPMNIKLLLSQVYVTMIAATGVFFIMTMGGLDFSQGSILGISSLVFCFLSKYSIPLAIIGGIVAGAFIGAFNGYFYVKRKVKSFVVTICTMFLFRGVIEFATTNAPVQADIVKTITLNNDGVKLTVTLLVLIVAFFFFRYTRFGKHLKAIGAGEKAAAFSGIATDKMKFWVYVLAGAITGLAAFVSAIKVGSVTANSGSRLETQIMIALVLGGMPISGGAKVRFENVVVGSVLYIILNAGLVTLGLDPAMQQLIEGIIFLLVVAVTSDRNSAQIVK
ncbi:MAG: ABC transporter permease [Lachnospiraceae bacterium]|nr:ABC transporter permease [Lachnospiraceae bacterium]